MANRPPLRTEGRWEQQNRTRNPEPLTALPAGPLLWQPERPSTLVIACSDGRLQDSVDAYLNREMGIRDYDRLFIPGGPGALTEAGSEYTRAGQQRRELFFLLEAHAIEQVLLIFHGSDPEGPIEAVCADYSRVYPNRTREEIAAQQERDADEVRRHVLTAFPSITLRVLRAQVTANREVRFEPLSS